MDSVNQGILPFTTKVPAMNISVPHNLGQEEATQRIRKLISQSRPQWEGMVSDLQENWNADQGDFSFKVMGKTVTGTIQVKPSSADVAVKLPLALLPFRSKIESELTAKARELLA